ncbi:TlpA disulfide reductase family protein [Mucilaginibacter sp.]|uniref:TlpA family protein disulfide reductase n=1 Tax=Mucilaginibacter sp. TaxID=1882438 RepID=UPI0032644C7B
MKHKICFLALLCLFLAANAQEPQLKIYAENITKGGISIGDKVPGVHLSNVRNLKLHGKPVTELNLSAFSGKLLILDFWATWCAPCRQMVPVMDSLQKVFGDRIQFLPVTYQRQEVVAPVLAQMRRDRSFNLPEVTGDVLLHDLFPHRSLPHFVWIDGRGTVVAITEEQEVTADNIRKLLLADGGILKEKRDTVVAYHPGRPLLIAGNGGEGKQLVYHAVLSGFLPGVAGGVSITPLDSLRGQTFGVRNAPFPWLCRLTFGEGGRVFPRSRTLLRSVDSAKMDTRLSGDVYNQWLASGNGWSYELVLPPALAKDGFAWMQEDLRRLFPAYLVRVERQQARCLALVRTTGEDRLKSAGGELLVEISPYAAKLHNAHLSQLMMRLERQYLQNAALPVIDATHYTGRVDLDIEAKLWDVASLNGALEAYGLALKEQSAEVEMLVIRDNPDYKNLKP